MLNAGRSTVEAVTPSAYANQEPWLARFGLDLLSQVGDMSIHSAVGDECLPAPHFIQQLIAFERLTPMADKSSQKLKFNRGHLDGFPGSAQLASSEVHLNVAKQVNLMHLSGSAAQCGLDTRAQFARAEGLGDIIVGSQFQTQYLVRLLCFCGEQDDRHEIG